MNVLCTACRVVASHRRVLATQESSLVVRKVQRPVIANDICLNT